MRKRILSMLLCIVLCLSLLPTTVFAEGEGEITSLTVAYDDSSYTATVSWDPFPGASEYSVSLQRGTTPIASSKWADTEATITGTTFTIPKKWFSNSTLGEGNIYRVYVHAHDESGQEIASSQSSSAFTCTMPQLSDPTSVRLSDDLTLSWDAVQGANTYRIKLYRYDSETNNNIDLLGGTIAVSGTTSTNLYDSIPAGSKLSRFSFYCTIWAEDINANHIRSSAVDSTSVIGSDIRDPQDPQPTSYSVTIRNGSSSVSEATAGTVVTITVNPAPAGEHFARWSVARPTGLVLENNESSSTTFTMPEDHVVISAIYETITLPAMQNVQISPEGILTWDPVEGAAEYSVGMGSGTVSCGGLTEELEYDLKADCQQYGWESDTYPVRLTAVDSSRTPITEQWTGTYTYDASSVLPKTITVTYDANGGTGSMATETLTADTDGFVKTYTFPECDFTAPAGQEFDRWEWVENGNTSDATPGERPWLSSSITVKAIWKDVNSITVTYDANGGSGSMATETLIPDTDGFVKTYTFPECGFTAPAGKEFDKWEWVENGNTSDATPGSRPWLRSSIIVKAIWKDSTTPQPTTYTVTYDANGGTGTMNPEICTIDAEKGYADYVFPACGFTAPEGKEFDCWTVEGITGSISPQTSHALFDDMTVKAVWKDSTAPQPTTYTVSFEMNGHGDQVAAQPVNEGAKATKPTDPTASGWTFDGWYADATFSAEFDFDTAIAADTTIYAKWTANSVTPPTPANYTVTFNMNGHGTQVAAQTVEDGNKATKPADPTASGWTFNGWYADATFSAKFNFDSAITANTTVYAKWTEVKKDEPTKPADPTNPTQPTKPADPTSPQTGDNSHLFLWIALLLISGSALAGTAVYGKKRKYNAK